MSGALNSNDAGAELRKGAIEPNFLECADCGDKKLPLLICFASEKSCEDFPLGELDCRGLLESNDKLDGCMRGAAVREG